MTEQGTPDPDDPRKPEDPTDLTATSWRYVARTTAREFSNDQCTDLAAALTYYAVLAVFPAAIALVSLLGVVGQGPTSVTTVIDTLRPLVSSSVLHTVRTALTGITSSSASGFGLVIGIVAALWSASGYVGAFGRAMNRIYEIEEGRPFWKLRPVMLLLTLVAVVLAAIVVLALVLTGPAATTVGNLVGLGSTALSVWNIAKWPVMLLVVVVVVALLYYVTPNIEQPKFRWISVGAGVAIVSWVVVSVLFGIYVAGFSNYNKTYGSLAGAVVFLLWLWITNLALLFGAELDSELERARELQAGLKAEDELKLPPRDSSGIEKAEKKRRKDRARGRRIRRSAARGESSSTADPGERD